MESTRKWIVMMGWVELGCFSHFSFRSKIVALLEKEKKHTFWVAYTLERIENHPSSR